MDSADAISVTVQSLTPSTSCVRSASQAWTTSVDVSGVRAAMTRLVSR